MLKKLIYAWVVSLACCASVFAQQAAVSIIPQPRSIKSLEGTFDFSHKTKIVALDDDSRALAAFLNDYLLANYNFKLEYVHRPKKIPSNAIVFERLAAAGQIPSSEDYSLNVTKKGVRIAARGNEGMFYGLQSLLQLLPAEIEKGKAKISAVEIMDQPRFRYRGMHLDVARHFFPVEFVKQYIDLMAQYKFNRFHWHLTDDQGWRIEIKKYPRLTEIGSKRKESQQGPYTTTFRGDGIPIEGFYTQEQIREVVAYAKARYITVIPEIELPGHSSAALAAYPQLGCKENYEYKVQMTWGIFKEVFCLQEATFKFLEDVLDETIALFPDSPYIHIGGDEVLKDHWKESAFVQELKQKENLKDEHEVQSFFIRRIEKFINSKGKKIIGWDEILEGGLAPNATVMSWRGEKGGIAAAKMKHDVIMTPTDYLYFDYGQGDPQNEPLNIGNYVPLEKVYSYDPHPKELSDEEKQFILGAQANLWTEYIKTPDKAEYMVFPRILALAETVWSPLEKKNYADFLRRLSSHFERLDRQNVNYRIPEPLGLKNVLIENKKDDIVTFERLAPLNKKWKIFYTLDGTEPTEKSKLYEKSIVTPIGWGQTINLKTIVVNEKGRKSVPYAATIMRREKLKASPEPAGRNQGVNVQLHAGEFKSVRNFPPAAAAFATRSILLQQFAERTGKLKDAFGAAFEGYIYAPKDEIYEFKLEAAGGAVLEIGGETVIDLDADAGRRIQTGLVPLEKGFHKIRLRYFKTGGEAVLNLSRGIKGQGLARIYGGELFH